MKRFFLLFPIIALLLTACETPEPPPLGADGLPLPQVYRISARDRDNIQFRMLDSLNVLRQAAGAGPVVMSSQLNAAAITHSLDMSRQNRPWHFGSNGSSPLDRVKRAGYTKTMLGENISETYETELQTLAAWMDEPGTRRVLLDRSATDLGFGWYQESNGKIWWTLLLGG